MKVIQEALTAGLRLFLKALEEAFETKRGTYIEHLTITPQRPMPAFKQYTLEVWLVDGNNKQLISTVSVTDKVTTEASDIQVRQQLIKETYKTILKYYGI